MKFKNHILLVSFLILVSCSEKNMNEKLIPDETFIQFYADYMIVQEIISLNSLDSLQGKQKYDSLYNHYNLTPDQVTQTKEEYNKDLSRWQKVYDKVIQRLDTLQRTQSKQPEKTL